MADLPFVTPALIQQQLNAVAQSGVPLYGATANSPGTGPASAPAPTGGTRQPFSFPNFNMPGFPYANLPDQLAASFVPPNQQFTNGSQYGRWNGVNNNGFGLFPNQFQGLFGFQPGPQLPFQPPYANNGYLGSNQGPGSNPGSQPPSGGGAPTPSGASGQPPLPPGQSPFTPGLPNVPPAGYGGGMQPPYVPPMSPGNVPPAGYGSGAPSGPAPTPPPPSQTPGTGGVPVPPQGAYAGQNKSAVAADTVGGGLLSGPMQTNSVMNGPYAAQLQQALSYGDGRSRFAQAMLNQSGPRNVSATQFNQVAAQNPRLAETLLGMTPGLSNAVMQQNGMSQQQMNQFINGTFYNAPGAQNNAGLTPQNLAFLNSLGIR